MYITYIFDNYLDKILLLFQGMHFYITYMPGKKDNLEYKLFFRSLAMNGVCVVTMFIYR